ncbi:hypothetical protein MP228_012228 [Amoeboaphelidium protococcarum]|nr:hypothetical protein MP228_012228 [Amoeboaphelidium protococcarum]
MVKTLMDRVIACMQQSPQYFDTAYYRHLLQKSNNKDIQLQSVEKSKTDLLQFMQKMFTDLHCLDDESDNLDLFDTFQSFVVEDMDLNQLWQQIEMGRNAYVEKILAYMPDGDSEAEGSSSHQSEASDDVDVQFDSDASDQILKVDDAQESDTELIDHIEDDNQDQLSISDAPNGDIDQEVVVEDNLEEDEEDFTDQERVKGLQFDEDEDEEEQDEEDLDASNLMYADFFAPPSRKQEGNQLNDGLDMDDDGFDLEHVEQGNENNSHQLLSDEEQQDLSEVEKLDLLLEGDTQDDGNEDEEELTPFQKQQLKMKRTIEKLEQQNVQKKEWTMLGEATSKSRPENSLLEHQLEFDHGSKPVPIITDDFTSTIESMIKQRIKDAVFDDVERNYELPPSAQNGAADRHGRKRERLEIDDNQNAQSLSQMYENEYQEARAAAELNGQSDVIRLAKEDMLSQSNPKPEHLEIKSLLQKLCYNLDSLTQHHFVPRPAEMELRVLSSSTPAIDMEEALPVNISNESVLAPQEVYAPQSLTDVQTKSSKKRRRKSKHGSHQKQSAGGPQRTVKA